MEPKEPKNFTLSFKVTKTQLDFVQEQAKLEGVPVAEYARDTFGLGVRAKSEGWKPKAGK